MMSLIVVVIPANRSLEVWRNEGSPSYNRNLIKKMWIKISPDISGRYTDLI
jgi:hypothetical protein